MTRHYGQDEVVHVRRRYDVVYVNHRPINHLYYGIMTVLTGGLWGFVWG